MADKPSKLSTLTTKQKVVGLVTVVIILFIIYEVVGMFSSESAAPPPTMTAKAPAKPMTATAPPNGTSVPGTPNAPNMAAGMTAMPPAPNPANPVQPMQVNTVGAVASRVDTDALKEQETQQKAYLDSLNQLQILKIKRDIAETNQAIAAARLATETANKSMSDLLTQPVLPQSAPSNGIVTKVGAIPGQQAEGVPAIPPPPPPVETPFTVVSVAMQYNHWNAVLSYQGKLYNVAIGDTLFDGSTVASINRNGVVLVREGKRRKISILASI